MALKVYEDILAYVRRMAPVVKAISKHDPNLARQLRRALTSAVLNTAEGAQQRGGKGRNRFEPTRVLASSGPEGSAPSARTAGTVGASRSFDDAMGSTDESRAAHQAADALEYLVADPELIAEAVRIAKVLYKLAR